MDSSIYNSPLNKLYQAFNTNAGGLSMAAVKQARAKYGSNVYRKEKGQSALTILFSQFRNPLTIILLIVVFVSFYTGEHVNAITILIMLVINAILGFVQEYRAKKSLEKLQKLIKVSIKVKRDGLAKEIDSTELVPGDIVILNHGSIIPADVRLITCNNLIVNEAALTGESKEVIKNSNEKHYEQLQPQDMSNFVFQGTSVLEGAATGIVVATGTNTFLGKSVELRKHELIKSNYVRNINKFSKLLFYFVVVITSTAIIINVSLGRDLLASFILGISLALGITPETMPVVISIALSRAAYKLSRQNVLIKRLSAFEDFGNVDVICTDKTGTITTGQLDLTDYINTFGKKDTGVLETAAICTSANPNTNNQIYDNQIDRVVWKAANAEGFSKELQSSEVEKVWDFDFNLRSMAVITKSGKERTLIVKGAYESIKSISKKLEGQTKFETQINDYEEHGYKIIAVAKRKLKDNENFDDLSKFKDLTILGLLLFKDQPRENMKTEFSRLKALNVNLKIITGDSAEITKHICEEVGLEIVENRIITGDELDKAIGENIVHYGDIVAKYNVFVRVSPAQKLNIIEALKRQNHVVAYLGDGINDVGALESADVGIAVDTATDVAKDTADIIILDPHLATVTHGIIEGRRVFVNTMKFIFSTMSSSFGNVITITFASLFLPFIPLLPVQVILLDFLSDFQHLAISTDNVDKELVKKPKNWDFKAFYKYVIYWGLISTLFDFFHIVVINHFANSPELFRTTWIIESVTTEVLATFSLRTALPFFRSMPSKLLLIFSALPILVMVLLSYSSVGDEMFYMVPPNLFMLLVVLLIVLVYFIALELVKKSYFRDFWKVKV